MVDNSSDDVAVLLGDHHGRSNEPGTFDIDWISGPNPGYDFTIGRKLISSRSVYGSIGLPFLVNIEPATGYLD